MITLFVMIIIIIGLMASLGYSLFVIRDTSEMTSAVQRNAAQMERIAYSVAALAKPTERGGLLRAPYGVTQDIGEGEDDVVMTLPADIIGSRDNSWGVPYGWCPVVQTPEDSTLVTIDQEVKTPRDSYDVRIALIDEQPYVVGYPEGESGPPIMSHEKVPDGIIGFVISAAPGYDAALPDCRQIGFNEDGYLIINTLDEEDTQIGPGGTVTPVYANAVIREEQRRPKYRIGNGLTWNDAIAFWNNDTTKDLTIIATSNDGDENSIVFDHTGPGVRNLHLQGEAGIHHISDAIIVGTGVHLTLESIHVDSVIVKGGGLRITDGVIIGHRDATEAPLLMTAGHIEAIEGIWTITNNTGSAITIEGGEMVFGNILQTNAIPPWSVTGHGLVTIVDPDPADENERPIIAHDTEGAMVVERRTTVKALQFQGTAEATCPVSYPYPIQGYCTASSGVLSSSQAIENGWRCQWSSPTIGEVENAIPLPADGEATAICSISPQR